MSNAFLGNLTYNQGQEFGVIISDASFDELAKYNNWAESETNGGTTYNGLGTNIKNSFIVCAPQQENNYNLVSITNTKQFIDTNNDNEFNEGDIIINNGENNEDKKVTPIGTVDTGQYDLIITDHLGNLIRLTPPFTDINTDYFAIQEPDISKSFGQNTNTMYNTRALTLNSTYTNLLKDTNTVIDTLNTTYTPILDTIDKYNRDGILESRKVTMAYSYVIGQAADNSEIRFWGTFSFDMNDNEVAPGGKYDYSKDETLNKLINDKDKNKYEEHIVSWKNLLNSYIGLKNDFEKYKSENGNSIGEIMKEINELKARPYMYTATPNTGATYIWSGNSADYEKFVGSLPKDKLSSYIFIHQYQ